MSKSCKRLITFAAVAVLAAICLLMAACGAEKEIEDNIYNVIGTEDTYTPEKKPMSGAAIDSDITVDGNFDDGFYSDLNWLTLNKVDGDQTATVKMTVRIAEKGLLIAADVEENTLITYNAARSTSYESGIEFYLAFGDGKTWEDGLYEIDMTAGERFAIRKMTSEGVYTDHAFGYETAPYYAVVRDGSIKAGECTGYRFELFLPYALFGRESGCDEVYVNPTHVAMPISGASALELSAVRNWYNFGQKQRSLFFGWTKLNQGFAFDRNGAVIESPAPIDSDISVDGNFDESYYNNLRWLTLNKVDGGQTATVKMTVHIAEKGLLIAADVAENTRITYDPNRATAFGSGMEFYLAFGDGKT